MSRKKSKKFQLAKSPKRLPDGQLVAVDEFLASVENMHHAQDLVYRAQLDMAYWLKRLVTSSPVFQKPKKWQLPLPN